MQNIRYYRNDIQLGIDIFEITKDLKSALLRLSHRQGNIPKNLYVELTYKCEKVRRRIEWSRRRSQPLYFLERIKGCEIKVEDILLICLFINQDNKHMSNIIKRQDIYRDILELCSGNSDKIYNLIKIIDGSGIIGNPDIVSIRKSQSYKLSDDMMGEFMGASALKSKNSSGSDFSSAEHILEKLNERVVGQERAKQVLSVASFSFMTSLQKDGKCAFPNILLLGPTGSGKTHLMQSLAEILGQPFVQVRASSFTQTGYVGSSVVEVIDKLKRAMKKKGNKKGGIAYIDEIDKIAVNDSKRIDIGGRAVQEELLNIMDKSVFSDKVYRGGFRGSEEVSMDTSRVLFVCGGAFAEMEDAKPNLMGFASDGEEISPGTLNQDLINYGMLPELLGRLPVKIRLEDHSVEAIVDIILNLKVSPLNEFIEFVPGIKSISDIPCEDIEKIALRAKEYGVGARGIYSALEEYFAPVLYGTGKTV